jgi:hypothetical protein
VNAATVEIDPGFDVGAFLDNPLVAHVAASGPTLRPLWFLWEDAAFWWLTGGWTSLTSILKSDPGVALVVDRCDLETGTVQQVMAEGDAEIYQLDGGRAERILERYLGPDVTRWPERFKRDAFDDPATRLIRLEPVRLWARDRSYAIR